MDSIYHDRRFRRPALIAGWLFSAKTKGSRDFLPALFERLTPSERACARPPTEQTGTISTLIGSYLPCLLRFAQYAFIRAACSFLCAALNFRFFLTGAGKTPIEFLRGCPRPLLTIPPKASIARLTLSRSSTSIAMMCSVGIVGRCYHPVASSGNEREPSADRAIDWSAEFATALGAHHRVLVFSESEKTRMT